MLHKCDHPKGGFKSEDTGEFLHLQHKYSKSLSWAENLNFPPKTVNNLFKLSAQDSDLEYLFWRSKNSPVSSDLKPPLAKVDFYFIEFLAMIVKKFNEKNIFHLTWNFSI